MNFNFKKVAVIPARGGSTRLQNKNIYPLRGKPLIRWITESVIQSNCFDQVIISTDSDKIFDTVSDLDVRRHHRHEHHATEKATVLNAMISMMSEIEKFDIFSYFLPTCPFITSEYISKGIDILTSDVDSVVSICEYNETIQIACEFENGLVNPVYNNLIEGNTNSKFLKKYYRPSGAFHISWWNKLKINKNFFKGKVKGVLVPKELSVDINDIQDINFAESILKKNTI